MTTDQDIDELLRQDEAELKAKRKRLKAFATAIEEVRRATQTAAQVAEELIEAGDLSRVELGNVFKLTKSERSALIPARKTSVSETPVQNADTATGETSQPNHTDHDAG
ncbi:hypothetical protein [Microbacterium sp. TPU 3598]|uniref:hypothetical protein n=1 Tax=Microbacterium sp. TPU 3598 TaxID=1938334 RepID=UPI000BBA714A|nr:hypothetical protein [Microbacterium sp. TPU 3598]